MAAIAVRLGVLEETHKSSVPSCVEQNLVRGKNPHPCRRELCDSVVSWPLLLEALLGTVVGLVLPRMRH